MAAKKVIRKFKTKHNMQKTSTGSPDLRAGKEPASLYASAGKSIPPVAKPAPEATPQKATPISIPPPKAQAASLPKEDIEATIPASPTAAGSATQKPPPLRGKLISRPPAQNGKTGVLPPQLDPALLNKEVNKALASERESVREQINNYLEVCDSLADDQWQAQDIIDILHVLICSLNMDVVSMALVKDGEGIFDEVVSRGYLQPPTEDVKGCWAVVIRDDKKSVEWPKLMSLGQDRTSELAVWIEDEGLDSVGYVPIHDNTCIFGFLLVGARGKKEHTVLASPILELAGGRIGLSIAARKSETESERQVPVAVPDPSLLEDIDDQIQILSGHISRLSNPDELTPTQTKNIGNKSIKALGKCRVLLEKINSHKS